MKIENLNLMRKRLEYQGGVLQDDRMIQGKYETLQRVLKYSYQACDIRLAQSVSECPLFKGQDTFSANIAPVHRALINPDKVKQDYDDKILSVDYKHGYQPGDVIEWVGTHSYWLIHLQALTEDAYFRSEIRRCKFYIKFRDKNDKIRYTWAAIRGPVETAIDSIQKNQVRVNVPNLTLNILVPNSPEIREAFNRYGRFIFADRAWKVTAPDSISTTGVLEFTAIEDFINDDEDDQLNEVVNGLVVTKIDPNDDNQLEPRIIGETFIKPQMKQVYTSPFTLCSWAVQGCKNMPVTLNVISDTQVELVWTKMTSGNFTLLCSGDGINIEKKVVVESLF